MISVHTATGPTLINPEQIAAVFNWPSAEYENHPYLIEMVGGLTLRISGVEHKRLTALFTQVASDATEDPFVLGYMQGVDDATAALTSQEPPCAVLPSNVVDAVKDIRGQDKRQRTPAMFRRLMTLFKEVDALVAKQEKGGK